MGYDNHRVCFEVAIETAKEAGALLLENFEGSREIDFKGRIDIVTEMDRASEELIVNSIRGQFPAHSVLAEEGNNTETDSEYTWIIDPLDGTTNYAHGFGFFAVSIALVHKKDGVILGVVYAPYLKEIYTALAGQGAFLNDKMILVSEISELEKSLVATGFPYDVRETRSNIDEFEKFLIKAQAVRRPGSTSIDLCCVAAGKFDGFWEMHLHPWDTAAGFLIVEEAGGTVSDFSGKQYTPFCKEILATNGRLHEKMRRILIDE